MDYKIINVGGHYIAYDNSGNFICSGDTPMEVAKTIEEIQKGM
jgi:hypothetical protein